MGARGWLTSSHWAPTVCIHVATLLTRTASQRARKTPMRRGAQVETVVLVALILESPRPRRMRSPGSPAELAAWPGASQTDDQEREQDREEDRDHRNDDLVGEPPSSPRDEVEGRGQAEPPENQEEKYAERPDLPARGDPFLMGKLHRIADPPPAKLRRQGRLGKGGLRRELFSVPLLLREALDFRLRDPRRQIGRWCRRRRQGRGGHRRGLPLESLPFTAGETPPPVRREGVVPGRAVPEPVAIGRPAGR